ncbi:MAG: hypothetical protein H7X71_02035 [Chitinophagales bacterium]|nr:hypothetical protein [Chitinophagales bacterium]
MFATLKQFLTNKLIKQKISGYAFLLIFILCNSAVTALQDVENDFKNGQIITSQNPEIQHQIIQNFLDSCEWAKLRYDHDASLQYALKALREARNGDNPLLLTKALKATGDSYYYKNEFSNSIIYYAEAKKSAQSIGDAVSEADISIDLGFSYVVNGRPDSALFHTLQALKFYDQKNYPVNKSWCYRILGDIQYSLNNLSNAKDFYEKGIAALENIALKDSVILREWSLQTSSVAMILAEQKKLAESVLFYKKSDSIARLSRAEDVITGNKN